jgi:transposase-like protein
MIICPQCKHTDAQIKDGRNRSGSQRYKCKDCGARYTPEPNINGYPDEVRHQALQMYVDGNNLRRIGRHLGVSPQSVANWVNAHAASLPETPQPAENETVELDELFTFIGSKKRKPTS